MKNLIILVISFTCFLGNLHAEMVITLDVATAGTLSTLISSTKKYQITNLVLTGNLNTEDFIYLGEMAGRSSSGVLAKLDLSGARIVAGDEEVISYGGGYSSGYNVVKTNKDEVTNMLFYDCDILNSIILPDSLTSIGNSAFCNCSNLKSFSINDHITSIGTDAFKNCAQLTEFIVDNKNAYFCSLDSVLYNKDKTILMSYPCKKMQQQFFIPNTVISIAQSAFYDCDKLVSVSIGDNVTTINDGGFYGCSNLQSIILGEKVASIGASALRYCTSLAEIRCNSSTPPKIVGNYVFSNGINLSTCKLYIPTGTLQAYWLAAGWGDFTNIIEVTVTEIKDLDNKTVNIHAKDGVIQIESNLIGAILNVYSIQGYQILKTTINESIINIELPTSQLYLLRLKGKTYKVAL